MAYKKRPSCPECGAMVRFNDSVGGWEYGKPGQATIVYKVWHEDCYIQVKQLTPAEANELKRVGAETNAMAKAVR